MKRITESELHEMLEQAYRRLPMNPDSKPFGEIVEKLYDHGGFKKLVGGTWPDGARHHR